jgi:hypothetical protein
MFTDRSDLQALYEAVPNLVRGASVSLKYAHFCFNKDFMPAGTQKMRQRLIHHTTLALKEHNRTLESIRLVPNGWNDTVNDRPWVDPFLGSDIHKYFTLNMHGLRPILDTSVGISDYEVGMTLFNMLLNPAEIEQTNYKYSAHTYKSHDRLFLLLQKHPTILQNLPGIAREVLCDWRRANPTDYIDMLKEAAQKNRSANKAGQSIGSLSKKKRHWC